MTTGDDATSEPSAPRQGEAGDAARGSASVVSRQHRDGVEVVTLSGELDLNSIQEVVPVLEAVLGADGHPGNLVVDLSGVTFADSSALNLLLRTHSRTSLHLGGPLHPAVERLFEVTGITGVLDLHPSVDEALAAARRQR